MRGTGRGTESGVNKDVSVCTRRSPADCTLEKSSCTYTDVQHSTYAPDLALTTEL